jgi:PPOX class probable F420-dependent enzyme
MSESIPQSHLDLLLEPVDGVLTTLMPDGQPQMSIVWADFDGESVLINTTLERQKGKNMQENSKVNVLLIDPQNGARYLEIRGEVTGCTREGAIQHANKQTQAYSNNLKKYFYGDIYPIEQKELETRVIINISPIKVNTDAIFIE